MILCVITLIAGVCLSGVHEMTAETIAEQQLAASAASYQEVCPEAETFEHDDTLSAAVEALGGEVYGTSYGNVYINDVIVGKDASGNTAGYVFSVTSSRWICRKYHDLCWNLCRRYGQWHLLH